MVPTLKGVAGFAALLLAWCACTPGTASGAPVPATVLFPGVASQPGRNNTQWRAEAVLTNVGNAPADVLLELIPRGQAAVAASLSLTLAAGETRRITDLYAAMSAPSGAGTLRMTGDVLAWVRSFNQAASGTFGQDVPPVTGGTAFDAGETVVFPINTPADPNKDFRSNLLLTNLEAADTTFTLTCGTVIKSYVVPASSHMQITDVGTWMGLAPGTAILQVASAGSWAGTVSSVDAASGDPTTVRGLVATTRSVAMFPGIGSASGYSGTQWRAEAVLYNPRAAAQTVTLEIIPRGGSAVAASTTLQLNPLEVRRLPDVYAAVSAPTGFGTLRVTGDVLTWVRSFNQGVGTTFGQDVPEITPGVGFGPGASVAFAVSSPTDTKLDFRSNVQVYNHESRQITLSLAVGTAVQTIDVPALSYVQQSNVGAWLGVAPGFATMSVVGTGRWSGTVSTVDPYLGDPTTMVGVLTTPNPAPTAQGASTDDPATATIGPAGGTLKSDDGRLTLTVPAGALASSTALTLQPIANLAWGGEGPAYRLGPSGTTFATPATLTFSISADDTMNSNQGGLGVASQDADGFWQWLPGGVSDASAQTLSVPILQLSGPDVASAGLAATGDGHRGARALKPTGNKAKDVALVDLLALAPRHQQVEEGDSGYLQISVCYAPGTSPYSNGPNLGSNCQALVSQKRFANLVTGQDWSVNYIKGGNDDVGRIFTPTLSGTTAEFRAPQHAPNPRTVPVQVLAKGPLVQQTPLSAAVAIGKPTYVGRFTITSTATTWNQKFTVVVDPVELWPSKAQGDPSISAYDLTGRVEMKTLSFRVGKTADAVSRIKTSAFSDIGVNPTGPEYFQIRPATAQDPLAVNWVLEPLTWRYSIPGVPDTISITIGVNFGTLLSDCRTPEWVSVESPTTLAGRNYVEGCTGGGGYKNIADWEFRPYKHLDKMVPLVP